ncbi:hypothetical protein QBC46DRAFT_275342 [Diplogelasinospora grovesii]|uniref:Uncharacterized protein n=1 Tax=Diplogelasinospora grovesii TaxID=303347 RepID=A0AAN6RXN1_9PEZI|nr:hypothetical protein QBC46DRAFT_275342 [Diplogelasinospora grovesii]
MASQPVPNSIPVRVFLTSLREYSAYLSQWQAHVEAETQVAHLLRSRIAELERENKDMRDCQDILQRMVDMQRELVASQEADLARASAESGSISISRTLSPALELDSTDEPHA